MKRRLFVMLAVAATAWALILAGQIPFNRNTPDGPASPEAVITLDEYARIRPGMSYEECVRIVGAEGAPYGSSESPEPSGPWPEWISFVWRNDADSYVTVSFHLGRVDTTHAFNLN